MTNHLCGSKLTISLNFRPVHRIAIVALIDPCNFLLLISVGDHNSSDSMTVHQFRPKVTIVIHCQLNAIISVLIQLHLLTLELDIMAFVSCYNSLQKYHPGLSHCDGFSCPG